MKIIIEQILKNDKIKKYSGIHEIHRNVSYLRTFPKPLISHLFLNYLRANFNKISQFNIINHN